MWKLSNAVLDYFDDNVRFANLFNGSLFGGRNVVNPQELVEGSEVYPDEDPQVQELTNEENQGQVMLSASDVAVTRTRDIRKRLKEKGTLRVLAVEDQNLVDYTMPWRNMNYDNLEYKKQIKMLKRYNQSQNLLETSAERMCGLRAEDRLNPTYTLCLYHGKEKWTGPRSLKDMMNFGESGEEWEQLFSDYKMHLVCLNEIEDFSVYQSPLKELFALIAAKNDRTKLKKLIQEDPAYQNLDEETANIANVMIGGKKIVAKMKEYQEEYEEEYDMCDGLKGIIEDSKNEGKIEGKIEGKNEERKAGIQYLVECCQEIGGSVEAAISQLVTKYKLSQEAAGACVREYWR